LDVELCDEIRVSDLVDYRAENDLSSVEGTRFQYFQEKFVGIVFEEESFGVTRLELAEEQW